MRRFAIFLVLRIDMQQGTRKGEWTKLMKPVVSKLTTGEMSDIAAYTSSLKP